MNKVFKELFWKRSFLVHNLKCCAQNIKYSGWTVCQSNLKRSVSSPCAWLQNFKPIHTGACLNEQTAIDHNNASLNNSIPTDTDTQQSDELDSKIEKFSELATDGEIKKKILMILMEHEVAKLEGKRVPSKLSVEAMQELLTHYSFSARVKYLSYLFAREVARAGEKRKKEIKRKEREAWLIEKQNVVPSEHITYGIGHNTMLVRVRKKSVMRYYNQRMANSVLHGQKFIVDLDYDCFMRKQDCNNCGEQLIDLYSSNRANQQPYDLYFCNVQHSSATVRTFAKMMPNIYSPDNFITLTEMSYLDIYPKEQLVYITPHAKEPLKVYDPNAIYIIGGLVDKCIREPVVMAKAKREGIKAVHLPYDEYLMWGRGNKSLPLCHIMDIMLEMKTTRDWNKAFRHVPPRKLVRSLDLFSEF